LHFSFSLLYFFNIKPWIRNTIFLFIILNPLNLYLANTIASDTLFGALTFLWLTELVWILLRPRPRHLILQAVFLFCCFTLRNTAYYYPLIAVIVIILSQQAIRKKCIGIALPFLFVIPFILYTENAAYKATGARTFSLLTGWQLANNVLYYYNQIQVDSSKLPAGTAREVNRLAAEFYSRLAPYQINQFLNTTDGNVFIINYGSPLKKYFLQEQKRIPNDGLLTQWGTASVAFEPFGESIIRQYPWAYFRYFVVMNAGNYLLPQLSDLKTYSNNRDIIEPLIAKWFHYSSTRITSVSKTLQGTLFIFQPFFFLLHLYFAGIALLILVKARTIHFPKKTIALYCLLTAYLLVNAAFSSAVTINLLRYQYIPMYVLLLTGLLLTENIFNLYAEKPKTELQEAAYYAQR